MRTSLNQACVLHHFGFRNVTISELSEKRRKIAEKMGTGFKIMSVEETTAAMPKDQGSFKVEAVLSAKFLWNPFHHTGRRATERSWSAARLQRESGGPVERLQVDQEGRHGLRLRVPSC